MAVENKTDTIVAVVKQRGWSFLLVIRFPLLRMSSLLVAGRVRVAVPVLITSILLRRPATSYDYRLPASAYSHPIWALFSATAGAAAKYVCTGPIGFYQLQASFTDQRF